MALDVATLADLIKSKVAEKCDALDPETDSEKYGDAVMEGIAEAVVEHIQAEAELKDAQTEGGEAVTGGVA